MTIEARVKKIIAEQTGLAPDDIEHDYELVAGLGCDSLDIVELMMALESEFEINISDEAFCDLKTVQQVIDHINTRAGVTP